MLNMLHASHESASGSFDRDATPVIEVCQGEQFSLGAGAY
ncbi:hypothetical protein AHiyo8_24860 [Arthrobacter sp. Hiyo8]|nr:hypothetical protein AHiyo8_24860 [Arthrobacter sp. Hiyo8]